MSGLKVKPYRKVGLFLFERWGDYDYQEGYVYHIKNEYFEKVKDDKLMQNKENGAYRSAFYCLRDEKTGLFWMVPLSSRVNKFQA